MELITCTSATIFALEQTPEHLSEEEEEEA